MSLHCRSFLLRASVVVFLVSVAADSLVAAEKFCRFRAGNRSAWGLVDGDEVIELKGSPFSKVTKTDKRHKLSEVELDVPGRPSKVIALAGNYKSHLDDKETDPKFKIPQPFYKLPSSLIAHGQAVVIPKGTAEVHFEAEMVVVIGKRAKNVSEKDALKYVFGVTCGNDISARDWQKNDVQWWRAKGSDTFGPCGPFILSGVNYDDLELTMRVNGKIKQQQRTKDLIHGVARTVSFISQTVTLNPGDLIFTGTPGKTSAIKPGDVLEVELEGAGVLKNPVKAAK